jgi:hypothetical protein
VSTTATRWSAALCAIIAALVTVATLAGVLLRGDLATSAFVTVRGETVDVVMTGIYRFNGLSVVSEGVGWDLVTLLGVVTALLVVLRGVWHAGLRSRLVAMGLLTYLVYQYLEYAMYWGYGPLFPLHVLIFALSLSALAILLSTLDLRALEASVSARFPHRAAAGLGVFMAGLLAVMWLPMIASTVGQTTVDQLDGATTLVVQALDLGLLVPLGIFTAVTVARRMPVGYVLASVVVVKAVAMPAAICAMLLVEAATTGELAAPFIAIFALTAVAAALIGARVYGSIGGPERAPANPAATPLGSASPAA